MMAESTYSARLEHQRLPEVFRPEDLARSHPSIPANRDISFALFMRRYMERLGRGGQRVAKECKAIGARRRELLEVHGGVLLTLFAALGKDQARRELLNDRQPKYDDGIQAVEKLTAGQYREQFPHQTARMKLDMKLIDTDHSG